MRRHRHPALLLALAGLSCGGSPESTPPPSSGPLATTSPARAEPAGNFEDATAAWGIELEHHRGARGRHSLVEIIGAGGGFLDHDGDGDLDLLLLATAGAGSAHSLLRNDGDRFHDVSTRAGLSGGGRGMGLAVGDLDEDGDDDLYVTAWGDNTLYLNRGDGSFEDATARAGAGDPSWSTAAVLFDPDGDGNLDLYVVNYVAVTGAEPPCQLGGHEVYCSPEKFPAQPNRLLRNMLRETGTLRFVDATEAYGFAAAAAAGLGAVAGDIDGDGLPDLYVANDRYPNYLFRAGRGEGGASYHEEALLLGCAYGEGAQAEAGMGTDLGDFDDDGDLDAIVTNLESETNSIYRNEEGLAMLESSYAVGIGASSLPWVGFGVRLLDHDLDGDLDLAVVNGHIWDNAEVVKQGSRFAQVNQLFVNDAGRFSETALTAAKPAVAGVGRALASGDVDGDGDLDLLVTNNGGRPRLLLNRAGDARPAIGLHLVGQPPASPRDAIGARVEWTVGGRRRVREVGRAGSYLASHDPRLLLAVDDPEAAVTIAIRWPDGSREEIELAPGAYHRVVAGEGVRGSVPFR